MRIMNAMSVYTADLVDMEDYDDNEDAQETCGKKTTAEVWTSRRYSTE
jgi:hypothetical protein